MPVGGWPQLLLYSCLLFPCRRNIQRDQPFSPSALGSGAQAGSRRGEEAAGGVPRPEACSAPGRPNTHAAGPVRRTEYEICVNILFTQDLNFKSGAMVIRMAGSLSPGTCQGARSSQVALCEDPSASSRGAGCFAPNRWVQPLPGVYSPAFSQEPPLDGGFGQVC